MQNNPSTGSPAGLATICGKMALMKNSHMNVIFGGRAWIAGKPRGDQKMMIIALGERIIFPCLAGLSAPGGSHYCS
jgi:hypothetical protein